MQRVLDGGKEWTQDVKLGLRERAKNPVANGTSISRGSRRCKRQIAPAMRFRVGQEWH